MKIKALLICLLLGIMILAGCVDTTTDTNDNENNGENGDAGTTPGWYLKEIVDYDEKSPNTAQYDVTYARGDITTTHNSTDGNYWLTVRTTWTEPPDYIEENGEFSIDVVKEIISMYLLQLGFEDTTSISTDSVEIELGYASASIWYFSDEIHGNYLSAGQGDAEGDIKEATFIGPAPPQDGPYGSEFGLTISCQSGSSYGTKYIYEWRE